MRVLVVEDAPRLRAIVAQRLREDGYAVDEAGTGARAIELAAGGGYDAIVLDLRLPDIDGLEICAQLRRVGCWTPILMLTARDSLGDRVAGLDAGADDYLAKPFEFPEVLARLRALVRRGRVERPAVLVAGDLRLDPAARTVERGGTSIDLTSKEFALLEYLIRHHDVALSRERLIEAVWDSSYEGDSNIVDVYVGRLREKIDRPFGRSTLTTVWGVGYRLEGHAESAPVA
ncbi:MAG: two-component system, OmpR family, response regulator [Gaiellales bacterium]|jgi:two-component system OmpR family response regulator|nr:two-component system, OmpR family, response regulator [Gaiellales bacterium]